MLAMLAAVCGCMVQGCCLHTGFLALTSKFSVAGKRGWYGAAAEKTALYQGANRFDGAFDLHVALFAKPHLVSDQWSRAVTRYTGVAALNSGV